MASISCSTSTATSTQIHDSPDTPDSSESCTGEASTSNIYKSYEDLANCYKNATDLAGIMKELKEQTNPDANWKEHFDVIENLRVLNKFYANEFRTHLSEFNDFLQKSVESLRSNLSKNALMLIKEVFHSYRNSDSSESFLNSIVPIILEKSVSEKGFLKNEARAALKALEKTGCNNHVIKVLCDRSFDKNGVISELSFQSLAEIVHEAKENLSEKINQEHLEILLETIAHSIDGKRAVNKRVAKGLCVQLKGIYSSQEMDFEKFMKEKTKLKEKEVKLIMESFKKNINNTRPDLSGFIKTKKMKQDSDKSDPSNFTLVSITFNK